MDVHFREKPNMSYTIVVEVPRPQVARQLRPGHDAVSISLPDENAVGGLVAPSDHVIVLFTGTSGTEKMTSVLMKNIRVVAVPEQSPVPAAQGTSVVHEGQPRQGRGRSTFLK